MSNKNKGGSPVLSPEVVPNGTTDTGGSAVPSSLSNAVNTAEMIPAETALFFDAKAREINVVRALLCVRIGGILCEVKIHCKESGVLFGSFLARQDVNINEDNAQRCMMLWRTFGKLPESDLLTADIHFRKLTALASIEEQEVREAILKEPSIKAAIQEATVKEIEAGVASYKEQIESKKRSIEGFREQLEAAKKSHKEELSKIKSDESARLKVANSEIERLKGELATIQKMQSKADVDAVEQFRNQRDAAQAEMKDLAGKYDTLTRDYAKVKAEADNVVTDKKLRDERKELDAELRDTKKALKAATDALAEHKEQALQVEGVTLPDGFTCTLPDALGFISDRGLLSEFVEYMAEPVKPSNGHAVTA